MKKTGFYTKDWFVALLIGLVFAAAVLAGNPFLERLEYMAYDTGVRMTHRTPGATDNVAIIAIDDPSIESIGRWPWPRSVLAPQIERLSRAGAKAIGLLIFLTEPQTDPGLAHIRNIKGHIDGLTLSKAARREVDGVRRLLEQAEKELDADEVLARAMPRVRNLYLPMFFKVGQPLGRPETKLPEYIRRHRLTKISGRQDGAGVIKTAESAALPLKQFSEHAAGIGHLSFSADSDGGIRAVYLALEYDGEFYPSLPLLLAAATLNLSPRDIGLEIGENLKLGRLSIRTDPAMKMYTGFYPSRDHERGAFPTYSFHDIQSEKVSPAVFKNKIVLIGATAVGIGTMHVTPVTSSNTGLMSSPELTANVIASILNQDFYTRPGWTVGMEIGILLAITLYLMFAMPRMGAKIAALVSLLLLVALIGSGQYLMVSEKVWLKGVSPALLLLIGHLAITTKRFLLTERLKSEAETDSAQTNRLLGLAFQGQGQLDMALDKYRKLPVDESVLELIYNVALDFERKRQFNKAAAAYDYILKYNPKFRDAGERKKRAQHAENTILLGARAQNPGGTLILDGVDQKPTLGRYQVEKELGKGAMGTVYLGRDPKLNRVVAIKTLALSQEFEESELQQVKERFFREAETAGRLNHPNIVTIYDAGEDHDLAYIAMEYLRGRDLTHYIQAGKLPSLSWIMDVAIKVADALAYAHKHDVVHRDIKPANIMFNEADKSLKVTDFGIARITASSRTKTGVILGTPSYMSPEQLAGKGVDGRSDLFSLGVMLFELLTGQQPFTGDSLATLMYQIANERHPDIARRRPEVPPCLRKILDRVLQKNPDKRYQTGDDLRQDLQKCRDSLAEAPA
jgi:serine/threonine-protein kinase